MTIPFPDIPNAIKTELDTINGKALKGAFLKGVIACRELGMRAKNPYKSIYKQDGSGTFAMAFKSAWDKGFMSYRRFKNG